MDVYGTEDLAISGFIGSICYQDQVVVSVVVCMRYVDNKTIHNIKAVDIKGILILHLFPTVDQPLLLRGDPFFLLHPFFDPLHLKGKWM